MSISKEVWLGSDNAFAIQLLEENSIGEQSPVDLSGVSKMELYLTAGATTITVVSLPSDNPKYIDWLSQDGIGYITFKLGTRLKALAARPIAYSCEMQIYDAGNTNGIVWFSQRNKEFVIRVRPEKSV